MSHSLRKPYSHILTTTMLCAKRKQLGAPRRLAACCLAIPGVCVCMLCVYVCCVCICVVCVCVYRGEFGVSRRVCFVCGRCAQCFAVCLTFSFNLEGRVVWSIFVSHPASITPAIIFPSRCLVLFRVCEKIAGRVVLSDWPYFFTVVTTSGRGRVHIRNTGYV